MHTRRATGFTLIELLIVMVILALLAALVGPALFGNLGKGRRSAAQSQISMFESALDSYRLDMGRYPSSLDGLVNNDGNRDTWTGPYLSRAQEVPLDPWNNDYHYTLNGREFVLISYGADGVSGGEEEDADIGH